MKRYGLAVTGVFPRQLLTVTDCKEFAEEALEYLTDAIGDYVESNLSYANLSYSNLEGAHLSDTNLNHAEL